MNTIQARLVAAAALALTLAPAAAPAAASYNHFQSVSVNSSFFTQVIEYNYRDGSSRLSDVRLGDTDYSYALEDGEFAGQFLYDYQTGNFEAGFYATTNVF